MNINITTTGTTILVQSPYDARFVERARQLGGKWQAADKAWAFPAENEDLVRETLADVYGWSAEGMHEQRIEFDADLLDRDGNSWVLDGMRILTRGGRDYPVRVAKSVAVVYGTFQPSGGSRNNPAVTIEDSPVVLRMSVTDKQLAWLRARYDELQGKYGHDYQPVTVLDDNTTVEKLTEQHEALQRQLDIIDRRIADMQAAGRV